MAVFLESLPRWRRPETQLKLHAVEPLVSPFSLKLNNKVIVLDDVHVLPD
eukprot:COSAG06_NODE_24065_length_676_cov_2.970383_2_plen_49_part_01